VAFVPLVVLFKIVDGSSLTDASFGGPGNSLSRYVVRTQLPQLLPQTLPTNNGCETVATYAPLFGSRVRCQLSRLYYDNAPECNSMISTEVDVGKHPLAYITSGIVKRHAPNVASLSDCGGSTDITHSRIGSSAWRLVVPDRNLEVGAKYVGRETLLGSPNNQQHAPGTHSILLPLTNAIRFASGHFTCNPQHRVHIHSSEGSLGCFQTPSSQRGVIRAPRTLSTGILATISCGKTGILRCGFGSIAPFLKFRDSPTRSPFHLFCSMSQGMR